MKIQISISFKYVYEMNYKQGLICFYNHHIPKLKPGSQLVTCLTDVNSSSPHRPKSRPNPDFLTPPVYYNLFI